MEGLSRNLWRKQNRVFDYIPCIIPEICRKKDSRGDPFDFLCINVGDAAWMTYEVLSSLSNVTVMRLF